MRVVDKNEIKEAVCKLFRKTNYVLPSDLYDKIDAFSKNERCELSKSIMQKLIENCTASEKLNVPICQDTGMAVVFIEIGQQVYLEGQNVTDAVNDGVRAAYDRGYLRKSVVKDPLFDRTNTQDNTPAIIYTSVVPGDKIRIIAAPKGFGSENMSRIKMFTPSATSQDIVEFVVDTVKIAGSNPCPPIVIGIGIGGDFEYAAFLAKKALTRNTTISNTDIRYASLEKEILDAVNKTGIGPQGFGGNTTCLAVNIEYFPTHIAGLPCAINIGCHVTRHAEAVI